MILTEMSADAISRGIAGGDISCVAVMQAALDRIGAVNGAVNAIVSLRDADVLMAEAAAADATLAAGKRRGWLHGVPVAVKDLANVAGIATSMGSPLAAGRVAAADDIAIARMRAAGAIFIGKTNTPEFGLGSHTVNPVFGATGNAYDATRSAGGSSGGAAVALATGMQWVCDGSDMMGSLRNPAGWNNVYGFRPTFGRVPGDPAGDVYLHPLSTLGPMARDVVDLAHLLDIQAGPDPRLPWSQPGARFADTISADLTGRRIAWLGDWGGAWAMEPGVIACCEAALSAFDTMGCVVETTAAPFPAEELWEAWITLRSFAVAARLGPIYASETGRAALRRDAIWEIERGLALTAQDIQRASTIRSRWYAAAAALFRDYDAIAMPTAQCWPFPVDWDHPKSIAGQAMDTYHRWMECVVPVSTLGLPALSVPAGFGAAGFPRGIQIAGPFGGDLGVLQLGQGWHGAHEWGGRMPGQALR